MSLLTYEEARPWARAIAKEVGERNMPPWHADAPAGTFHNERILPTQSGKRSSIGSTAARRKEIPGDLPPLRPSFTDGWSIGHPDVVLEMQEDYTDSGHRHNRVPVVLHPDELHRTEMGEVD